MVTFRGHPSGSLKVNKDDYKTDYKVDYGRATGVKGRSARRSRLLWPGFLGCTKRKQAARRIVIHATANTRGGGGRDRPKGAHRAGVLQPIVKFCSSRTVLWFGYHRQVAVNFRGATRGRPHNRLTTSTSPG